MVTEMLAEESVFLVVKEEAGASPLKAVMMK